MKHVGVFEAKTRLSRLIEQVEQGGEVVITRHGKPVAKLVRAADQRHDARAIARRRKAIAELRKMARRRGLRVPPEEIKAWTEEGRH
jgi:prevent-host-death family protein